MTDERSDVATTRGWLGSIRHALFRERALAAVPDGMRVYAVGDIHGCRAQLDQLTEAIIRDSADGPELQTIVYLGDYVDRGPDSKGVIARLLKPPPDFQVRHLRGNHDQCLLDFLEDPNIFPIWKRYGAQETLMSYGVVPPRFDNEQALTELRDRFSEALPENHLCFFNELPCSTEIGDYFFVHAGVRPGLSLKEQVPQDLLWIRDDFLSSVADFGKIVVHGHTPTAEPVRCQNRIGIDTGTYATGRLTAVVLEKSTCRFLHT